jgi:hypothetical protein
MTQIKGVTLTPAQIEVYETLRTYGPLPDHALVPLAQHVVQTRQSSSGIRTRRHELERLQLVKPTGDTIKTASGRDANVFEAVSA